MATTKVDRLSLAAYNTPLQLPTPYKLSASTAASGLTEMSNTKNPLKAAVEIIEDRLYYISLKNKPPLDTTTIATHKGNKKVHYYCVDHELVYWNFFLDFGPLNLGQLYRFCVKLNDKLARMPSHIICFYSSHSPAKRANAVCLMGAWQILHLNRTPEEAMNGFRLAHTHGTFGHTAAANSSHPPLSRRANPTIAPLPLFHDASPCACQFELTVLDCLRGLHKAHLYGFFDFQQFDIDEYEHFEQVENGDLNWIIYGKALAFAGPSYERRVSPEGYCTLSPADYIPYFREKNVQLVVRLNRKAYDEQDFFQAGMDHLEQFYTDGSCPPMRILDRVVEAFEKVPKNKAFAVHCKAGLGRTGTCIGAYIMKHYRFTASEVIGWMRICRPGMVIGPQQQFLQEIEQRMWQLGAVDGSLKAGAKMCANLASFNCLSNGAVDVVTDLTCDDDKSSTKDRNNRIVDNRKNDCGVSKNDSRSDNTRKNSMLDYRNEAVAGREGQAEGLLGARTRNGLSKGRHQEKDNCKLPGVSSSSKFKSRSKVGSSYKETREIRVVPTSPPASPTRATSKSPSTKIVTPDPPGKSKCDATRWHI